MHNEEIHLIFVISELRIDMSIDYKNIGVMNN